MQDWGDVSMALEHSAEGELVGGGTALCQLPRCSEVVPCLLYTEAVHAFSCTV